jgi:lysophospholipase L1-like esterase
MPRKRILGLFSVLAFAVLRVTFKVPHYPELNLDSQLELHDSPVPSPPPPPPRILCYGDSLTLGLSPPDHIDAQTYCPYSIPLRLALENSLGHSSILVDHRGLSGWTSTQFLKHVEHPQLGLQAAITNSTILLLLVGTNDIGRVLRRVHDHVPKAAQYIARNVWTLQELALQAGARHTLVVGIPLSRYHQGTAARLVEQVNRNLEDRAPRNPQTTFVPFPVEITREETFWSTDGLHLSCPGYEALGKALAAVVGASIRGMASWYLKKDNQRSYAVPFHTHQSACGEATKANSFVQFIGATVV